jgi:hypothetical protein
MDEIAAMFPTHPPFCHPTPVTRPTFCALLNFAAAVVAFEYAAAQSPSPGAANTAVADAKREIVNDFILEDLLHRKKGIGSKTKAGRRRRLYLRPYRHRH